MNDLQRATNAIHEADESNPAPQDDTWVAARERGYVNCLLTVLAQGGGGSVAIERARPLPRLTVSSGNKGLADWVSGLRFPYDSLSPDLVIKALEASVGIKSWNPFQRSGALQTDVVNEPGPPDTVVFVMQRIGWRKGLRITLQRVAA
jgi:hypothetical protein